MSLFCGIDWATDHHDIAVVDHAGRLVAGGRVENTASGFAALLAMLADAGEDPQEPMPVAIETDRGLWVAALTAVAQVFAASFTTEPDDLSQWRGYAGGTGGFAIGIPREVLENHTFPMFNWPEPENPRLDSVISFPADGDVVEVSYESAAIERDADEFISRYANKPALGPHDLAFARFEMAKHLARHKDDSFKAEQEFRVMTHTAPPTTSTNPLFGELRLSGYGLSPFTAFAINLGTHWRPAAETTIARLIVGPGPYQDVQVIAARQLLSVNGHDPGVVEPSGITFRG